MDSTTNAMAIESIVENLDITFSNCIFTYARLDNQNQKISTTQVNNIVRSEIRESIRRTNKISQEKNTESTQQSISRYEKCVFTDGDEEKVIERHLAAQDVNKMKIQFRNCQFIQKQSTMPSNVIRRVKRWFGTKFALNYIAVTAEIHNGKFKIKDIPDIIEVIVKKIQHTHFNDKRILDMQTLDTPVKFHIRY